MTTRDTEGAGGRGGRAAGGRSVEAAMRLWRERLQRLIDAEISGDVSEASVTLDLEELERQVSDEVKGSDKVKMSDKVKVNDLVTVGDEVKVKDSVKVKDKVKVSDEAKVSDKVKVKDTDPGSPSLASDATTGASLPYQNFPSYPRDFESDFKAVTSAWVKGGAEVLPSGACRELIGRSDDGAASVRCIL